MEAREALSLVAAQKRLLAAEREEALAGFEETRRASEALAAPLAPEDQAIQSMPDVSPTKWHLAHTAWFFETFILLPFDPLYRPFDPRYAYLFNSYYEAVGARHPRPCRGLLSRPTSAEIGAYRDHVAAAVVGFSLRAPKALWLQTAPLLALGIEHEKQHQELILMDIKHVFSLNPLRPCYRQAPPPPARNAPLLWLEFAGGLEEIGFEGEGFAFDNESPRHKVWLEPYRLASRLTTCGDYLRFIEEGGYRRPQFWLSDGWARVEAEGWRAPLYWREEKEGWRIFTLAGERALEPSEPLCHVSFFEADAFARWAGKRLPSEAEWEVAARMVPLAGNLADRGLYHPAPAEALPEGPALSQMIGDVWEWTGSAYLPYPRFRARDGAIGEYNGKFMCNQMVLRGGAAVTPAGHIRTTYRNFFPPSARWAFSGLRLAEDC